MSAELVAVPDPGTPQRGVPALEASPASLYLARLSPGSRRTMRRSLELLAEIVSGGTLSPSELAWHEMTYQHAAAVRLELVNRGYAPSNVNKMLAAWRGTLKEAFRAGLMTADQMARASDVALVKADGRQPAGRALAPEEIDALFGVCDRDDRAVGARDAAIVATLYGTALRRFELVGLDLDDVDLRSGEIQVFGKGHIDRVAHANTGVVRRLERWISVRGTAPGPLYVAITRHGTLRTGRLAAASVGTILQKRAREAGIGHVASHDMRRSTLTHLLDDGVDLALVAQVAGHRSVQSTATYDRRGETAKATAVARLKMPA